MSQFPPLPLYLFYGNQADAILKACDAVLDLFLTPAQRNENLTQYYPSAIGDTIALSSQIDEIAGDMATLSFIPEACKCVVVTNPAELLPKSSWGGKKGKPTKAEQWMLNWIEHELPSSGNHLILLAFEDESSNREVNAQSPLYKLTQKIGYLRVFRDTKAYFRIEESILARQPTECVAALRDLWKPGKGDSSVYQSVVRCLRYLLEANIARERGAMSDPTAQARYFPSNPQRNIFKAHPNVARKYTTRPIYRTGDLLKAYSGLLEVYRALRPRPGDLYVPDARGLIEQTLATLINSPPPR